MEVWGFDLAWMYFHLSHRIFFIFIQSRSPLRSLMKLKKLRHDSRKHITSDDKPRAIKFTCMAEVRTDGAARAEPNLFELCRVVTEEGKSKEEDFVKLIYRTYLKGF